MLKESVREAQLMQRSAVWRARRYALGLLGYWQRFVEHRRELDRAQRAAFRTHRERVSRQVCRHWLEVADERRRSKEGEAWDRFELEHGRKFRNVRKWAMHWLALTRRSLAARRAEYEASRATTPQARATPLTAPCRTPVVHMRTPERPTSAMSAMSPERPPWGGSRISRGSGSKIRPSLFSPGAGKENGGDNEIERITARLLWLDGLRQQHRLDTVLADELNAHISDASLRISCGFGVGEEFDHLEAKREELRGVELKMGRFQEMWRRHLPELKQLQARVASLRGNGAACGE